MRVCVFPDCPGGALEGLRQFVKFNGLQTLIMHGLPTDVTYPRDMKLPTTLTTLDISGELCWHIHAVHALLAYTDGCATPF